MVYYKWNIFKNILHYNKYPLAVILGVLDVGLKFTGIGLSLAIVGAGLTISEVIGTNILEETFVNIKVDKYHKKSKHLKEWRYKCIYLNKLVWKIMLLMRKNTTKERYFNRIRMFRERLFSPPWI